MIYLFFFFFLYIFSFFEVATDKSYCKKNVNISYFFLFCYFVILAGCRYKTGYDWNAYMSFFERINDSHTFGKMETGYAWVNYFFKNCFDSYALMQFTEVFLCTLVLFKFCKLYSPYPFLSLFIYASSLFFSYNMGLTRQFIAMSVSMITAMLILSGKSLPALASVALAFLFHKSSLVTLLFFVCNKVRLRKSFLVMLVVFSAFLNLFGAALVWEISETVFSLPFFPSALRKYSYYFANLIWASKMEYSSGLGFLLRMVLLLTVFIFKKNGTPSQNFVFNAVLVGLFIAAFGRNIVIIARLAKYFEMFEIILYAYLFELLRQKSIPFFRPVIFLPLLLYFLIAPYRFTKAISNVDGNSSWAMFSPWNSVFFLVENSERNARMKNINGF